MLSRCIIASGSVYTSDTCNSASISNPPNPHMANNEIYSREEAMVTCGKQNVSFTQWQRLGMDQGSQTYPEPQREVIMSWAKDILNGEDVTNQPRLRVHY